MPPPITIYHPVYAKFIQMMAEPQEFTHEELDSAQKFVTQAAAYYKSEDEQKTETSEMGSVVNSKVRDGFHTVAAITEVKAEIGEGGCDPIAQAECAYVAIYSSDEVCRSQRCPLWC